MNIHPVTANNFFSVIDLLQRNNLPTEDITAATTLFALYDSNELIGTIGLEYDGENALLRSLSTSAHKRGIGGGKLLVDFVEKFAKENNIHSIYLLTTTAADFFDKRNYLRITKTDVPEFIKQTTEFASTCPASAIVMKKVLQ